jgi:ABC-type branched-subunit amino acid transport system permease subunit
MGDSAIVHLAYALAAVALVALAATVKTDGYIANILMQATTYAIAVFGLSIVLGLCGQINLAQAAFFALGAYCVGLGTADYHLPFWLCLAGGVALAFAAGAGLGLSTLRLGGHYLAMVTISFQQILTVVLINAIGFTHGPDGVSSIGRPQAFASGQAYLALAVAALSITGYLVWRLANTRLGRAMRAVRDNELASSASGIDVFRTKVIAFALCAGLGGLGGGLFAGGFSYVSPDQFSFSDSIVLLTMALLGGRHGIVDPHSGMVAVPQERARPLSRDLRSRGHSHRRLHARRHLGLHRTVVPNPQAFRVGIGRAACFASRRFWRARRARGQRPRQEFRRAEGRRRSRFSGAARRLARADRPQRQRKDDDAQCGDRILSSDGGRSSRRRHRRDSAPRA